MASLGERLWRKVERVNGGCWTWLGAQDGLGYGRIRITRKKTRRVHRVAFELLRGVIPQGLVLDHLCRNRACVNPDHLDPVTNDVNVLRGIGAPAINATKTGCRRGHPYAGNLHVEPGGRRRCVICMLAAGRERSRRYRLKKKGHPLLDGHPDAEHETMRERGTL